MPHRPPIAPARPSRGGFTLLEIIVVVALLAVLSSLVVMGVGKMQLHAKRQQTVLTLHNLKSMYAEYDAVVHPKFPVDTRLVAECPGSVTADGSVNGSGVVDATSNHRFRGDVQLTCSLYALMRSVPSVRAGFDKLPPQSLMANVVSSAPQYTSSPYVPGATYDVYGQSQTQQYATVADGNGGYTVYLFRRTGDPRGTGIANAPRPPDFQYWFPYLNDATVRPVVDAWGNPIIVCLPGYMGDSINPPVAPTSLASRPAEKNDGKIYVNVTYSSGRPTGGQSTTIRSPDGRPFFLSAGPDGDFGLGDDNLYSFEQ